MLEQYRQDAMQRAADGLPPLPLTAAQTEALTDHITQGSGTLDNLLNLLATQVEPGVSKAAAIKARWLEQVATGQLAIQDFPPSAAIAMLATMGGGYNIAVLIRLLDNKQLSAQAADALKSLTKIYEAFEEIAALAPGNQAALDVLRSWAAAEWFTQSPMLPETISLTVYKVEGEINTDDFSPGNQAQSRADIPLHATYFGKTRFPSGIQTITQMRTQGHTIAFAGDVVGTGSSRKSAINSASWLIGENIPYVPNKRRGGVILGGIIAPIFYATARDAGMLAIECDVTHLTTGDQLTLNLQKWALHDHARRAIAIKPAPATLLDEYRAGGRLNLIIGRKLTRWACDTLGLPFPAFFKETTNPEPLPDQGFSLAQKMVGRACGVHGVLPGTVCEPKITSVASQDTTGPMTMQEIDELACLRFKTDLFMQSFCHTAAYPKASDLGRWQSMTETTLNCGGIALKPGDGVVHSWINKMLIPDTVGTGGDSHTRFPLGISFPAGSGLVAFAGALGFMPLEMPESVLIRFHGQRKPGITVRDMVNAIPYFAIQQGLLTVAKKGKTNIFAGTILEIEGIDDLSVDEAFELSDASAERSAAACTVKLALPAVIANVKANVALLQQMIRDGYGNRAALERRVEALDTWLNKPELMSRDEHAEYKAVLEIDLAAIAEPLLACPNDPDDVRLLSEVAGTIIDEAFIGSCMTHLSHLHNAARLLNNEPYAISRLWIAPSTRMDRDTIQRAGGLNDFAQAGARVEIPGCSLCMGNQARVKPGATVMSTSTRNFDNRLGDGARVFLGSTELTAISALQGALPSKEEYFAFLCKKRIITTP